MYDTVVLATDGSGSADRAVTVGLDLARRFDATVHALYVTDAGEVTASPAAVRDDLEDALRAHGQDALAQLSGQTDQPLVTAVREGRPADEICAYAADIGADVVVTGTRGRHGEHAFLLGSVAEAVVRRSPVPVLTVRQLEGTQATAATRQEA
ncbi:MULTISPECIES: universal stress protein [unclassified Halorhabdus]|uniref:universal stress protein n=1 Tax=unclassified Halorhabdus TaxID=2621901 RepID=UPI0023DB742F|nr:MULTISPECIES: universal stress protein [unclassified Halorhabdus]WEL16836.1 Nucleotide-binding protein, UspA family [Halorhabdus sp. SVX81]WEL20710.1 Nucleotide-binding protein, UspA family [Halorhabdus sp. BNX81]